MVRPNPFSEEPAIVTAAGINVSWLGPGTLYELGLTVEDIGEPITYWHSSVEQDNIGWHHIRGIWIAYQSEADVKVTIKGDGLTDCYILPSTAGYYKRHWINTRPRKGKFFTFQVDSTEPFWLHGFQPIIKPWAFPGPYQPYVLRG